MEPQLGTTEYSQKLLEQAKGLGVTGSGVDALSGAITSETLSGNETPIQIPEPTSSTTSGRISGKSQAILTEDELQQKAEQEKADKQAELQESQAKSAGILERIGITKKEVTAQVEEETDLSGQKLLRTEAVKKLRTAEVAELGELERLQGSGLTDVQRGAQEREIRRKYGFERLEAQLSFHMANADVVSAQETLNDRLTLELEPLYQQLDLQKGVSEQIYDQLTTSEKREWDVAISKTENAIKQTEELGKYKKDITLEAIKNGVTIPSYTQQKLSRAGSVEEVNQILADDRISLAKPTVAGAPTVKTINGVDMQWNPSSGKWETVTTGATPGGTVQQAQAQANVESLTSLVSDPNIRTAVGPSRLARFVGAGLDRATGGRQNFIASVEQIRSNLNLEALIGAKARGATFGALSDQELQVLASSASKIGTWAKKDGDGNVVAYNANEKDFKKELDKINNFARLDYIRKGGLPEDIGAVLMTDGNYYVQNSDGSYTQIN